jgi:hypothetical protein
MPIDANIPLMAARTPDVNVPRILQETTAAYDAMRAAPVLQQQRETNQQRNELGLQQQQQQQQVEQATRKAGVLLNYAQKLKSVPMAQRRTYLNTVDKSILGDIGIGADSFDKLQLDDQSLDAGIAQFSSIVNAGQQQRATSTRSESLAGGRITAQYGTDGSVKYFEFGKEIPQDQVGAKLEAAESAHAGSQQELYANRRRGALGEELDFKPKIASETTRATESQKDVQQYISDAVPEINKIRSNVETYNEAIEAIDAGASTGKIQSFMPSFSEASIDLDNVRSRLGLDVISMASFGALSEGELNLALNTALPETKEPAALREWIIKKQAAQEKAAGALEGAVQFLNEGNSLADLVAEGKKRRENKRSNEAKPKRLKYNMETGMLE